jgi:hypothetical protein
VTAVSDLIRFEISGAIEEFRWNDHELDRLLNGPSGPVGHELARRAVAVESAAKQHASGRPGPNVITGRLRGSITWTLGSDFRGVYADIGTVVHYAPFVERRYPFLLPALDMSRI